MCLFAVFVVALCARIYPIILRIMAILMVLAMAALNDAIAPATICQNRLRFLFRTFFLCPALHMQRSNGALQKQYQSVYARNMRNFTAQSAVSQPIHTRARNEHPFLHCDGAAIHFAVRLLVCAFARNSAVC